MEDERRAALLAPFAAEAQRHDEAAEAAMLPSFASAMAGVRDRSGAWRIKGDGWDALSPGLEATWKAAQAALKTARRDPTPEATHEWRKRVKDHWYQARLLAPIWPAMMEPHVSAADELGEILGQVNDLAVLQGRLRAADLSPDLLAEASDLASARHAALWAEALPLGRRLLAERPEALSHRWGRWWALRDAQA